MSALGRVDDTLALVPELNGRKLLLAGNHDRCWAGHGRRADGWTERYLDAGFAEVHQGHIHVKVGDRRILASHFPYRATATISTGTSSSGPSIKASGCSTATSTNVGASARRMINVGVDAWGCGGPVDEATLAALVDDGLNDARTPAPGAGGIDQPYRYIRWPMALAIRERIQDRAAPFL